MLPRRTANRHSEDPLLSLDLWNFYARDIVILYVALHYLEPVVHNRVLLVEGKVGLAILILVDDRLLQPHGEVCHED